MPFPLAAAAGLAAGGSLLGGLLANRNQGPQATESQKLLDAQLFNQLGGYGGGALNQGFGTLNQILGQQGRTDPQLFNRNLASIDRGTNQLQNAVTGNLARANMSGSGVGQALQAAVGNAGASRQSQLYANEAQLTEQRKRQDLNLLLSLILGPAMGNQQLGFQQALAQSGQQNMNTGATLNLLGSLLGGLSTAGSGGGGGAGLQ